MNRRMFLVESGKASAAAVIGARMLAAGGIAEMLAGCSFTATDDVITILALMAPAVEGIVPIVELSDPALTPVVQAAVNGFLTTSKELTQVYQDWKAASAAAQPGKLSQLEALLTTLKANLLGILTAANIKDAVHAGVIAGIGSAVLDEIGEIASLVSQVKAAGGTVAAAQLVITDRKGEQPSLAMAEKCCVEPVALPERDGHYSYAISSYFRYARYYFPYEGYAMNPSVVGADGDEAEPQAAGKGGSTTVTKVPKLGKPIHDSKHFRAELRAHLLHKTGDALLDALNEKTATKLK